MTFLSKLKTIQKKNNSLLCIGLDTDINLIPSFLRKEKNPQYEFNQRIIEATHDIVCAYKINSAFYEATGVRGWSAMEKTITIIPKEIITIADAKRGDIGNSSHYYAKTFLRELDCDSITVSPYMGKDSVEPFLQSEKKCAFLLALTSNNGAKDFQYLKVEKKYLYEKVIEKSLRWNTKKNIGFVVGATKSKELQKIRKIAPNVPLLIPGVGTQGGSVKDGIRFGCDKDGMLAIINASRSIIYASNKKYFAKSARSAAILLRDEMNFYREKFYS